METQTLKYLLKSVLVDSKNHTLQTEILQHVLDGELQNIGDVEAFVSFLYINRYAPHWHDRRELQQRWGQTNWDHSAIATYLNQLGIPMPPANTHWEFCLYMDTDLANVEEMAQVYTTLCAHRDHLNSWFGPDIRITPKYVDAFFTSFARFTLCEATEGTKRCRAYKAASKQKYCLTHMKKRNKRSSLITELTNEKLYTDVANIVADYMWNPPEDNYNHFLYFHY